MKAVKVGKVEVHLSDEDKRKILELFERYARAKEEFLEVIRKSPVRKELLRMMFRKSKRRGREYKEIFDSLKKRLWDILGDGIRSDVVECLMAYYSKVILTCLEEYKKLPKRVSARVMYLRLTTHKDLEKRRYRNVTFYQENGLLFAKIKVFKGRDNTIIGIVGLIKNLEKDLPELIKAIYGKDGLKLGDPCILKKNNDRLYLHIPIIKNVEMRIEGNIMGIDFGISKYLAYWVVINPSGDILARGGIPSEKLKALHELYDEILRKKQMRKRSKRRRVFNEFREFFRGCYGLEKYPSKKFLLRHVDEGFIREFSYVFGYSFDEVIEAIRRKKNRLSPRESSYKYRQFWRKILEEMREKQSLIEKTELGESKWSKISTDITYHVVNELIEKALTYNVQTIVIERLKGLRKRVLRRINIELNRLWREYEKSKDEEILEERRRVEKMKKILSRFPYRRMALDLKYEANWYGILVREVSPKYTSITCPICGYINKRNRVTRDTFRCQKCGYEGKADFIGALNIAIRGVM